MLIPKQTAKYSFAIHLYELAKVFMILSILLPEDFPVGSISAENYNQLSEPRTSIAGP